MRFRPKFQHFPVQPPGFSITQPPEPARSLFSEGRKGGQKVQRVLERTRKGPGTKPNPAKVGNPGISLIVLLVGRSIGRYVGKRVAFQEASPGLKTPPPDPLETSSRRLVRRSAAPPRADRKAALACALCVPADFLGRRFPAGSGSGAEVVADRPRRKVARPRARPRRRPYLL